jgi:ribosomal protein S8
MIWYNTHFKKKGDFPKWLLYITSSICFIIAFCAVYSSLEKTELVDKLIPAVTAPILFYLGLCGVLTILKGDGYVESIEKEDNYFILHNIFNKQIRFTAYDVLSVETSKFSIVDKLLTGFAKYIPGLDLILKDGSKYYITSDMENIDTLKEHLIGKNSDLVNNTKVIMIWNDTYFKQKDETPKWLLYAATCICFIMVYLIVKTELMDKLITGTIGVFFLIYLVFCNILKIFKGDGYVESIKKIEDRFILTNIFKTQIHFTASDVLLIETAKSSITDKLLIGFTKHAPGLDLILKDGNKYYITSYMEKIDTLKEHLLGKNAGMDSNQVRLQEVNYD